ncbi:phenylpyruvate tautomerase PptA (4-oxalocrotonate tautomerase family) [Rhodopseudomonas julia]|uniref:Phenylpyruvate tautomerase PptA (4-oxalocrotonate tautomerase family) n=1 Tax=Rhodopseudomonas julia TaxID=200617 RepID=A0ABU0C727_9BRAD|nr:hypothetical protein [Rhodopseudomonas julia]MDQ0326003.1 phenylpyruvate tautomerase PptA (4-oxalocrotonate tautomerase family) [Rhodopseudomonas julia]
MPLAELRLTRGALSDAKLDILARDLTAILLEHQGARPGSAVARSITRLEVTEFEPRRTYVGGNLSNAPCYRLSYTVPLGALNEDKKRSLVEKSTNAILAAEGTPFTEDDAYRVWCLIDEVPDGNWASAGKIWRWRDIMRWVARREIAARRQERDNGGGQLPERERKTGRAGIAA